MAPAPTNDRRSARHLERAVRGCGLALVVAGLSGFGGRDWQDTPAGGNCDGSQKRLLVYLAAQCVAFRTPAAVVAAAVSMARAQNIALIITQSFGFLAILTGFLYKAFTDTRERRWAKEDIEKRESRAVERHDTVIEHIGEVKSKWKSSRPTGSR